MSKKNAEDPTAKAILARLGDAENYPDEVLAPYAEVKVGSNTYYFTSGGFLYRKDPEIEAIGGFFCGYLTNEVWHCRKAHKRETEKGGHRHRQ